MKEPRAAKDSTKTCSSCGALCVIQRPSGIPGLQSGEVQLRRALCIL